MKKICKTIFVRNSFFAETYNIIFDVKKLNKIGEKIGYDTDLGNLISQLILEDDIITLSFYISKLFEYIPEFYHSSNEEKYLFFKLLKLIRFKEYYSNNSSYDWFDEAKKVLCSTCNDSYDENGVFSSFDSTKKDNYDLLFQLPNINHISFKKRILKK